MTLKNFIEEIKESLETEIELELNTDLRQLDEYDSMGVMTIIALVDEHFDMKLSSDQLKSITTIQSLINLIGNNKFD